MKTIRRAALTRPAELCSIFPLLVFSAVLCGCRSPREPASPPDFTLSDHEARRAGALALYSQGILLENSETGDAHANRLAANEAFRRAVLLDPDNRRPVEALLSNLADSKRYDEATAVLNRFLERHADDIELRVEAARMAEAAGQPAEAARHCAALLAIKPDERELTHALIRLYFQSGQVDAALSTMRSLQSRFHDAQSAALPVGWAVHFTRDEKDKDPERSLACLALAISRRTNDTERAALMTFAAENWLQLGNTNAAESVLLQAYQTDPSGNAALLRLGALWAARPDATNQLARQAQRARDPTTPLLILAATHQALDDNAAAAAVLQDVYALQMRAGYFPSESFYLWLAALFENTQQSKGAERILGDALAAYPSSHEIKNFLAYMWAEQGVRLDEADRLITAALVRVPENTAYLDTKGWILFKQGRFFDALQFLLKAAENDRREPVILDHVGDVLKAAGRESEAVAFWTRSHEIDPEPAVGEKLRQHGVTLPSP
jgi:Tfp pilus assembly protein PilF